MTASMERPRGSLFKPRTWSFTARAVVIPSLGMIAAVFLLAVLINQTIRDVQLASVQSDFQLLGQSQARRVAQSIVREVSLLNALAHNSLVIEHLQEHHALIDTGEIPASHDVAVPLVGEQMEIFIRRFPQFGRIIIVAENGHLIADSGGLQRTDYGDEEWVQFVTSTEAGRLYLRSPELLAESAQGEAATHGVEIALPVLNALNQPIGVLYAVWDVALITEATTGPRDARVMIVDDTGMIITDSAMRAVGTESLDPELVSRMQDSDSGSAVGLDDQGVETVFGYSNLAGLTQIPEFELTQAFGFDVATSVRSLNWTVIVSQDANVALAAIGLLTQRVFVLLVTGGVLLVVAIFLLARTLVEPLNRLTEAAGQIGAGKLDTPIPVIGVGEVGQLADVLRGMVAELVRRVEQLRAATEVTRAAQVTLDIDEMLERVAEAIHERLAVDQARVYLLNDDASEARLVAAAGEVDERVLERDRQGLPVGPQNVIGEAVVLGHPQVTTGAQFLTGAGSEVAVPIQLAGEPLGVMYVASNKPGAFGEDDVSVLELLADQVATSVQNARLFEQSEKNLRQIEALNRRLTREGWLDYATEQDQLRYSLDSSADSDDWPESIAEVAKSGQPVARPGFGEDGEAVLAVPISLRGEVIGTLGVKQPPGHEWTEDEISLVQAIGERVGFIAEDIRLLDEAGRTARREQTVSEVSARLQRATQLDSLLQVALSELSGVLGSGNVSLRIGTPPQSTGESEPEGQDGSGREDESPQNVESEDN